MVNPGSESERVKVAILDDHQSVLDGYAYRLNAHPEIEIVFTAQFGNQLELQLKKEKIDILILDVSVPVSEEDSNPIALLHMIPRLVRTSPEMAILVISMHKQRTLIQSVMEAGAKGYIVKDDHESILKLGDIIISLASGGFYFSEQSYGMLIGEKHFSGNISMPSKRQIETLSLCASAPDLSTDQLAKRLNIAPSTLRNLLSDCYKRLKVHSRAAAIEKARQLGLITPYPSNPQ